MAAESGVANPSTVGSRAAGRATSAPPACRSGTAAESRVANPRAAGPSDTDIYCSDCEMWLPKKVVSAPIALPDREKKEVGNPLRAGGSSTANQCDRSNSADATDAEGYDQGYDRSPSAVAMLPWVANPENASRPVTDWYAPHLMEEAVTSPTLFISGAITATVAVDDERPHRFLAQRYKRNFSETLP